MQSLMVVIPHKNLSTISQIRVQMMSIGDYYMQSRQEMNLINKTKTMNYQKEANNSLVKLYEDKVRECEGLEGELRRERNISRQMTELVELYSSLANYGAIYVNTYSQDCDGVESYSTYEFKSIEEHNREENIFAESIEGSFSWKIVPPTDARTEEECGTYGQGWDIN